LGDLFVPWGCGQVGVGVVRGGWRCRG
jgi:hypothetical protein